MRHAFERHARWAGIALALATLATPVPARAEDPSDEPVEFRQRNMSGPRLGLTFVPGDGAMWDDLNENDVGRVVSQFGWHFERQIVPRGGGPQFLIEAVPMVGGVEYGKVIPSLTLAMGIRFPAGYEFGLGPSMAVSSADEGVKNALAIAVGKSFDYGGVSLPVDLVLTTNPGGQRVSLIVGYAIQKTKPVDHAQAAP